MVTISIRFQCYRSVRYLAIVFSRGGLSDGPTAYTSSRGWRLGELSHVVNIRRAMRGDVFAPNARRAFDVVHRFWTVVELKKVLAILMVMGCLWRQ
ncbi:uncharacterized protein LOC111047205 isoform X2 [Nilaparvata lugens]|uniref:uncharacterized protein LOC111047205 isoform X2 n=1 Tax=Nilaparvata lugens TaxID=108931 RepID=UPI00193E9D29|nr:uncharacterized protein LOC111047205 isoform X2 [Nilaparvata lugens]